MADQSKVFRLRALTSEQRAKQARDSFFKKEWNDLAIQWHLLANLAAEAAGKLPQNELVVVQSQDG